MPSKYSIVYTCLLIFVHFVGAPLPSIVPVCLRDDPQLAQCIIRTLDTLRTRYTTGDLGDGFRISRLDPLYIPRITYGREHTLQTRMTDVYVRGLRNMKIDSFKVNIKDLMFENYLSIPRIDIKANYKMIFGYFGTPISTEGKVHQVFGNIKCKVLAKGRLHSINGQRYLNFDPIYFKILEYSIKHVDFTNFFSNKILAGPILKNFLVSNINYFSERIAPDLEKRLSEIYTKVINQIALSAPFDELFPI